MSAGSNPSSSSAGPGVVSGGGLPPQYKPVDHEARIRARWDASGAFHADPGRVLRGEAEPFAIFIPPPNVTGALHLGHALNNTLQDILTRWHRMRGFETLWMPGTDHAGIATQAVVERRLRQEGKLKGPLKQSMKREEFVAQVQVWKDEYEARITNQLKAMGCSCDFARQRFTMDEVCARAVYEAFFRFFKDGLIYRGKRLVNWDPVLQTAVADDECYDEEIDGNFYYLRYPLVRGTSSLREGSDPATSGVRAPATAEPLAERGGTQGGGGLSPVTWGELRARGWPSGFNAEEPDDAPAFVTVATTRPETYLGDTAVAVNPSDPRAAALRGLRVRLPIVGRVVSIIEDDYVVLPESLATTEEAKSDPKAKFATGFLKVTPAHDANDHALWERHIAAFDGLPSDGRINVLAPDATISDQHGWTDVGEAALFVGLKREIARKRVVEEFKARGLCEKVTPYRHSVPHSDRSKAIIEPYLSDQWYLKVTDSRMAASANEALHKEQLRFHPARYAKTYELWHDNIRDWCISRQLWWGHRIPVWRVSPHTGSKGGVQYVDAPEKYFNDLARSFSELSASWGFPDTIAVQDGGWSSEGDRVYYICTPNMEVASRIDRVQELLAESALSFVPTGVDLPRRAVDELALEGADRLRKLVSKIHSRDPDVLDTWFSSALWPLSTLGWPDPDQSPQTKEMLAAFNPSSVLSTAREIITLWVSRMVMFNRYLHSEGQGCGPVPFRDVFIHAVVQDGDGKRMSKSAGNGVDPLDIIASHGADAMRFTLCQMTTQTQDVRMPVVKDPKTGQNTSPKFDLGRNVCNKLWNAARFAMGMMGGGRDEETERRRDEVEGRESAAIDRRSPRVTSGTSSFRLSVSSSLSLPDRWMLSRLATSLEAINGHLTRYEFSEYAQACYDLLWRDFCDWYLEAIKPTVQQDANQRAVLELALDTILRVLHPLAPFVTEAIWEHFAAVPVAQASRLCCEPVASATGGTPVPQEEATSKHGQGLLCVADWPGIEVFQRDEAAEAEFESIRALVGAIREVRAAQQVKPSRKITLHLPAGLAARFAPHHTLIGVLAGVGTIAESAASAPAQGRSVVFSFEAQECRVSDLTDAVDAGVVVAAERARLEKALQDAEKTIATIEARLANPGYAQKAPPAMVKQSQDQLAKAMNDRDAAKKSLAALGGGAEGRGSA